MGRTTLGTVASLVANGRLQEEEGFLPHQSQLLPGRVLPRHNPSAPTKRRRVCIDLTVSSPSSRPSAEKRAKKIENFVDDLLELAKRKQGKENADESYMGKEKKLGMGNSSS